MTQWMMVWKLQYISSWLMQQILWLAIRVETKLDMILKVEPCEKVDVAHMY